MRQMYEQVQEPVRVQVQIHASQTSRLFLIKCPYVRVQVQIHASQTGCKQPA